LGPLNSIFALGCCSYMGFSVPCEENSKDKYVPYVGACAAIMSSPLPYVVEVKHEHLMPSIGNSGTEFPLSIP